MMDFLKDFFLLRWNLPRWAIPTLWTVYFLNQFYMVFSIIYGTFQNMNFPPMAARWQVIGMLLPIIISNVIQYAGSQLLLTAIFGVLLFSAQRQLFGKET
ncbi:MAG: hypothetical protein ABIN69_09380 [Aestuariivirga sp.]